MFNGWHSVELHITPMKDTDRSWDCSCFLRLLCIHDSVFNMTRSNSCLNITCTESLFICRYLNCDQRCVLFIQGTNTVNVLSYRIEDNMAELYCIFFCPQLNKKT